MDRERGEKSEFLLDAPLDAGHRQRLGVRELLDPEDHVDVFLPEKLLPVPGSAGVKKRELGFPRFERLGVEFGQPGDLVEPVDELGFRLFVFDDFGLCRVVLHGNPDTPH